MSSLPPLISHIYSLIPAYQLDNYLHMYRHVLVSYLISTHFVCPIRPSHTPHETAKNAVIFHAHYNFFSQLQRFFHQFFMSNDFLTDLFRKIFAVLCVVCMGLNAYFTVHRAHALSLYRISTMFAFVSPLIDLTMEYHILCFPCIFAVSTYYILIFYTLFTVVYTVVYTAAGSYIHDR